MDNLKLKKAIRGLVFISSFFAVFLYSPTPSLSLDLEESGVVQISATVVGDNPPPPGGGNTGLGDVVEIPNTSVRFSGFAYPYAPVTLLKEGKEYSSVVSDASGSFTITLEEQYQTNTIYTLFAKDILGNKSVLLNYPVAVQVGYLTHLSGIRFAPTINTDKLQVSRDSSLKITGYALPGRNLHLAIQNKLENTEGVINLTSDEDGFYEFVLDGFLYPPTDYVAFVRYIGDARNSKIIKFTVGDVNVLNTEILNKIPGDCNFDNKIDLVDFSVLAFWYKKANPPVCLDTNNDKVIDLIDFSILAFYWTG